MKAVTQVPSQNPFLNRHLPSKSPRKAKPISKTLTKPSSISNLRTATQDNINYHPYNQHQQQQHKDLLVETFHYNTRLKDLIEEVSVEGSNPIEVLERDGDWTKDQLWAVVVLLLEDERVQEAIKVTI